MNQTGGNLKDRWAAVAAALMAAAVPVGIVWTLSLHDAIADLGRRLATLQPESQIAKDTADAILALHWSIGLDWIAVGAAAVGAILAAVIALGRPAWPWLKVAALVPLTYLLLSAAPQAVSRDWLPLGRMALAVAAIAVYLPVVLALPGRLQYSACCSVLGVAAVFFYQWQPPPPKPVPIAKPLAALQNSLLAQLNGPREHPVVAGTWTGKPTTLLKEVESQLGVDEYVQLALEAPAGGYREVVFVTYNANAQSLVAHVPWVCMPQAGFRLVDIRQDEVTIRAIPGKEIQPNVMEFEGGEGHVREKALVFQYFNVGGTYTSSREMARYLANAGAIGRTGSYISQTQVIIWLPPQSTETPMAKSSTAYQLGIEMLNILVPLLEHEHYPDLRAGAGG